MRGDDLTRHRRTTMLSGRRDLAATHRYDREKIWTADELSQMTPAEQDAIFEASVVTDLETVPSEFLDRVDDLDRQLRSDALVLATAVTLDADLLVTTDRNWPPRGKLGIRATITKL